MDLTTFRTSVGNEAPPDGLTLPLQALWWDAKGSWDKAHSCAQAAEDRDGSAVHAYLHRKEPDLSNARYWYSRAERSPFEGGLDDEWAALATELLSGR
jgi:hypothetical protein